jgi:hypothetical protein
MGSCRPAPFEPPPGDGDGEGAEKRSSGRPPYAEPEVGVVWAASGGSDKPPSPDKGFSSSAKASKDMRSDAFLLGLALRDVSVYQ